MFDSPATINYAEGVHLEPGKVVTVPINDVRRVSGRAQRASRCLYFADAAASTLHKSVRRSERDEHDDNERR